LEEFGLVAKKIWWTHSSIAQTKGPRNQLWVGPQNKIILKTPN